MPLSAQDFTK